ncbi:MAG: DUF6489 family protein [Rhodospirillaceae bacterium]
MKITVNVDCTPEEARTFLGLPDIKPMQDALVARIEERLSATLQSMEPDAMLRLWFPAGLQSAGLQSMDSIAKAMMASIDTALNREPRK